MKRFQRLYLNLVNRRKDYIGNRAFMVLLAIQVGFLAALAAVFLKYVIHFIETDGIDFLPQIMYFFFPTIGILIVVSLYGRVFKSAAGFHGIGGVLDSIRKHSSILHYTLMYAQMITGAITIGLGGSSGLESPTVVTGSAIGSNSARFFRLNYKFRTLFIGCGTAATISAIFNAPIAGVIFATEVILPQFSATIFIPILISAATGAFFSELFLGDHVLFRIEGAVPFTLPEFPLLIVMGIFCGFLSLYYTKIFALSKFMLQQISNKWKRAVVGGLILGTVVYMLPVLFGEGYVGITQIISGDFHKIWQQSFFGVLNDSPVSMMLVFGALLLLKPLAASVTVHSGGEGGQFAPSFVTGGFAGFFFFLLARQVLPHSEILHPTNYILLGMGAVLAGVMHSPLTGIFLVAEVTESYDLLVGLMMVTAISFFTKIYFDRVPIHFKGSKSAAEIETTKHEFISLNNLKVSDIIDRSIVRIAPETPVTTVMEMLTRDEVKVMAVCDQERKLIGLLSDHQLRKLGRHSENWMQLQAKDIMVIPATWIDFRDQMDLVVYKFDTYNVDYLPVLNKGTLIGFVSRMSVLASFRESLKTSTDLLGD
ncbi:MAG: chloride channel protein [Flavobacteriales bacterium]|nr:chloride channel protein [Flavobacteriales bacterium]